MFHPLTASKTKNTSQTHVNTNETDSLGSHCTSQRRFLTSVADTELAPSVQWPFPDKSTLPNMTYTPPYSDRRLHGRHKGRCNRICKLDIRGGLSETLFSARVICPTLKSHTIGLSVVEIGPIFQAFTYRSQSYASGPNKMNDRIPTWSSKIMQTRLVV